MDGNIKIEGYYAVDGPFTNDILDAYAKKIAEVQSQGHHKMVIEKMAVHSEDNEDDKKPNAEPSS